MAVEGQGISRPDRSGATRTVAEVDLWPAPAGRPEDDAADPAVFAIALSRLRHTIRSDDRICPYSLSRIAVEFGPQADAVAPGRLGARLARAVGQGLADCGAASDDENPAPDDDPFEPGRGRPLLAIIPSTTVVTVERIVAEPTGDLGVPGAVGRPPCRDGTVNRRRRQRIVVRYSPEGLAGPGAPTWPAGGPEGPERRAGAVLVFEPDRSGRGQPGLAAVAAADVAERLGYLVGTVAQPSDDALVAEIGGHPLDLVVLVVGPEPPDAGSWSASTWSVPARLVGRYVAKGIPVLAVSVGASMMAMATCVEEGAGVAYDLADLREALGDVGAGPPGRLSPDLGRGRLPRGAEAVCRLTAAERRVLFYLTIGRSPQAIADAQVVSLATVRSHIRSVLRKLAVRSQLAAVALATSRAVRPEPDEDVTAGTASATEAAPLADGAGTPSTAAVRAL